MEDEKRKIKISQLQVLLTTLLVVTLLTCNIITVKQIQLPFNIVITGAALIFPITYILSDLFSEVYGYKWSRFTCYLAFAMNVFMVLIFTLVIFAPASEFYTGQEALEAVLGSTPRILGASLLAFVAGDFANDFVFKKLKEKHLNDFKGFKFRAIFSSFCGLIIDNLIFLPIAFLGVIPLAVLLKMLVTQILIKLMVEILILPITTLIVKKVSHYEKGYL